MTSHQIDYLRFTYSPDYALQQKTSVLQKLYHALHIAQNINPEIRSDDELPMGKHGFTHSIRLYVDDQTVGYVAAGSNHGKAMVDLSGQGCFEVDWENASRELSDIDARLTRVDVCVDDFEGEHSVHDVREAYKNGLFDKRGQRPSSNMFGSWDSGDPRGEGLSYYIGKPGNGLATVSYEKGKQLGNIDSKWVRHECRFGRTGKKELPHDILMRPYDYMRKAYQYFEWVEGWEPVNSTHLHITKETIKLADLVHWAKQSYGKLINVLEQLGHTSDQIYKLMRTPGIPERLNIRKCDYGQILLV